MQMHYYTETQSPAGPITIASDGRSITMITFRPAAALQRQAASRKRHRPGSMTGVELREAERAELDEARRQLAAYFAGELQLFDLPLAPAGTPFQQAVWTELRSIRFGETTSYGALAARLGRPGSSRAVGAANGRNPIAIVVPCHRVIGANGTLTGYAGGIERKSLLLEHEARIIGARLAL